MGLDSHYLAFCFDEACDFILDMRVKKVKKEKGQLYEVEEWKRTPHWSDIKEEPKPRNNSSLFAEMKANLEKWKGGNR